MPDNDSVIDASIVDETPEPSRKKSGPRSTRRIAWALLLVILAVVFVAGFFVAETYRSRSNRSVGGDDARTTALDSKSEKSEPAAPGVAPTPREQPAAPAATKPIVNSVALTDGNEAAMSEELRARLDQLDTRLAAAKRLGSAEKLAALGDEIRRTDDRLSALEQQVLILVRDLARSEPGRIALLLAASDLRVAVKAGLYATELAAVATLVERSVLRDDANVREALATLAQRRELGLATPAQLRARFGQLAGAIATARNAEGSWIDRAWQRAATIVTVRRTGDAAVKDSEVRVALAERRLDAGDVSGAHAELAGLAPAARAIAQPWLDEAAARVMAERASAGLYARLVRYAAGET